MTKTKCQRDSEKLVKAIYKFIYLLDDEMKKTSSFERGKNIAKLNNFLEFEADRFARNTLDFELKKIENLKRKNNVKK